MRLSQGFAYKVLLLAVILSLGWFIPKAAFCSPKDAVRLTANQLIYSKKNDEISLRGNVRFHYKETVLTGEEALFNIKTREGRITGGVRIYQPGTTVTGQTMIIHYAKQQAFLKGDVKLVTVKDPSQSSPGGSKELQSGITTLTCDDMDYQWLKQEGKAQGNVTVIQRDRRAYADNARYSGKSEIITLLGKVRFEQGSDNWVTCGEAILDLKTETFMAKGAVTGNFLVIDTKTDKPGAGKAADNQSLQRIPDKIIVPPAPFQDRPIP